MNSDPETRITLSFLHFNVHQPSLAKNNCKSYVKIYDGNSTKATQIGRKYGYCGKRAPPTLMMSSTGNSIFIVFRKEANSRFYATFKGKIVINPLMTNGSGGRCHPSNRPFFSFLWEWEECLFFCKKKLAVESSLGQSVHKHWKN